ncbi:caspase-3 [Caerostris darwini]|uniref:Caspase-3 n=1 Tax=Caerostris darwini TaxID=1538125 RepID=A0AAV4RUF0_9ARAC|nr:caspase-3 [Caerostris darwini]
MSIKMSIDQGDVAGNSEHLSELLNDQVPLGDSLISAQTSGNTQKQQSDEKKCGDCLIFNYEKFCNEKLNRPGSCKDAKRLKHDFENLNFNVHDIYSDLTKDATLKVLQEVAKKDHSQSKYFVCCFLTHGDRDSLCMKDTEIDIDVILNCFSRSCCKTLDKKPKIFIIQACRGKDAEEPLNHQIPISESTDYNSDNPKPDILDFLVVYSTYEGTLSFKTCDQKWEENNHGSYFIDELCRSLEQFSDKLDLLEILNIVNYRIATFFQSITDKSKTDQKKQMPCFMSGLRTEIKFNKKIEPYETESTKYFDSRRSLHRLGLLSTKNPSRDQQKYAIHSSKGIQFLSILNMKGENETLLKRSSTSLWKCVAKKDCIRREKADFNKNELKNFLKEFSGKKIPEVDCFICFVASYGKVINDKEIYLYDKENKKMSTRSIVEYFVGYNFLVGKPKIFIFVTFPHTDSIYITSTLPEHADILEVNIDLKEPNQLKGVVENLCNILNNKSYGDLLNQLTRMNSDLVENQEFYSLADEHFASFSLKSSLTKTLILP